MSEAAIIQTTESIIELNSSRRGIETIGIEMIEEEMIDLGEEIEGTQIIMTEEGIDLKEDQKALSKFNRREEH
jgi:hypothetical protein